MLENMPQRAHPQEFVKKCPKQKTRLKFAMMGAKVTFACPLKFDSHFKRMSSPVNRKSVGCRTYMKLKICYCADKRGSRTLLTGVIIRTETCRSWTTASSALETLLSHSSALVSWREVRAGFQLTWECIPPGPCDICWLPKRWGCCPIEANWLIVGNSPSPTKHAPLDHDEGFWRR